jgi:transposase
MLVELSVVEQRYHAVTEVLSGGIPVVEVAERYRVSHKSVRAWLRRFRQDGLPGVADQSHRLHHHPGQLTAEIEARVRELRRTHPRWGPRGLVHEPERPSNRFRGGSAPPGPTRRFRRAALAFHSACGCG